MTTENLHTGQNFVVWTDQILCGHAVAIAVFTGNDGPSPQPILASAVCESGGAIITPGSIAQFVAAHADRTIVCCDAAQFHWMVDAEARRVDDDRLRRSIWEPAKNCRLVDLDLLDQLLLLAEGETDGAGTLLDIMHRRCGATVEAPEQITAELLRLCRTGNDEIPPSVANRAINIARAVYAAFVALGTRANEVAVELEMNTSEAWQRFGTLGVGLQAQGAIALHPANCTAIGFDVNRSEAVERYLRHERELHARALARDRSARRCFRLEGGAVRFDRTERPEIKSEAKLALWLAESSQNIVDRFDLPVIQAQFGHGRLISASEDWGANAQCHVGLAAWARCNALGGAIRFLETSKAPSADITYGMLPRLRSNPPQQHLSSLLDRQLLIAPPEHTLLIGELPDLDLRAFAAVCRLRFGRSSLADAFSGADDAVSYLADRIEPACSQLLGHRNVGHKLSVHQIARILLKAAALRLGLESTRTWLNNELGSALRTAEVHAMDREMLACFPELASYLDDTVSLLAANLEVEEEAVTGRILSQYSSKQLRATITGHMTPNDKSRVLSLLGGINRNSKLFEVFNPRTTGGAAGEALLAQPITPASGRARCRQPFAEGNAEHLDLADDAWKAALFSIVAQGFSISISVGDRFGVMVPASQADSAQASIAAATETAASEVLSGIPVVSRFSQRTAW